MRSQPGSSQLSEALHEVLAELSREDPGCDGHFPGELLPEGLQLSVCVRARVRACVRACFVSRALLLAAHPL